MNFRYPKTSLNAASRTRSQQAIATSYLYLDQPRHDMWSAVFHSVDPSESLAFCVQNEVRLGAGSSQWTETCPSNGYLRVTNWRQEGTRKEPQDLEQTLLHAKKIMQRNRFTMFTCLINAPRLGQSPQAGVEKAQEWIIVQFTYEKKRHP